MVIVWNVEVADAMSKIIEEYVFVRRSKMSAEIAHAELLPLVANLVSAHFKNNAVDSEALPEVIRLVYDTLNRLVSAPTRVSDEPKREPAVPVKKSILPDHIVCLEDGLKFRSMKRHLASSYGMTPEEYRERWRLPDDYPMVAPNYTKRRSDLAKEAGLGRKSGALTMELYQGEIGEVRRIPEGFSGLKALRKKITD